MPSKSFPTYSRYAPATAALPPAAPVRATRSQSILEYALFIAFGLTIVMAAVGLYITNSAGHRRVPNRVAAGIAADRVNVLVMAVHRNARTNLPVTDSLMILSIKPSTRQTALIGIPRDLWVDLGNYGTRRIGAAPAVGLSSGYPGQDAGLTSAVIENVVKQPVHAFIRIDTATLPKVIDSLGGVDVEVRQGVYEHRMRDRFPVGRHHLNGERAKRYAFSAYVQGRSAERFAREERHHQVAAALLAKASQSNRVGDLAEAEETNLTADDIQWLAKTLRGQQPQRVTLAPYMETREVATVTDRGEVVAPRGGTFAPVHQFVARLF